MPNAGKIKISKVMLLFLFIFISAQYAQPAFPGAEGGGSVSVGGRGGKVIEVTNLNDSGPGSLREAIETFGRRTIVFKVGGTINLKSVIAVRNSYMTIAGQTAPGDGILLRSSPGMKESPIVLVNVTDIIIRYIRVRPGPYANKQAGDAVTVYKSASNVIIDHCSLTWATDENTEVWVKDRPGKNFTWQWNIISEGIGSHSCGFNSGSNYRGVPDRMTDISLHHNLFSHNGKRSPLIKVKTADVINNIIYGWKYYPTQLSGGVTVDIIGNKYVTQPGVVSGERKEIIWKPYDSLSNVPATGPACAPSIYFVQNIGPNNNNPDADAWNQMMEMTALKHWGYPDGGQTGIPRKYKRNKRRPTDYPITINNVLDLDSVLLASNGVGATMRLDEYGNFIPNRDTVDKRILNEYRTGTGKIITDNYVLSLYPKMENGIPYIDKDHDGMADAWEIKYGLDPTNPNDRNETNHSSEGYTNLELFLNGSDVKTDINNKNSAPENFVLKQNYPNPFNPTTTIGFALPRTGNTELSVYNILGQKIITLVSEELSAGFYEYQFDASNFSSGIYFYKLQSDNFVLLKKMLLMK